MEASEFSDFFELMFPRLARYAQRRVSACDAEDIAATTLQIIWVKSPPSPAGDIGHRQLQSLAYRIADGLVRNSWRSDRAYRRALTAVRHQADVLAIGTSPGNGVDSWPAWAEPLTLTDREVLELIVDGYKVAEIATILACTPAAVSMRLQRAKRHARQLWADLQEEV